MFFFVIAFFVGIYILFYTPWLLPFVISGRFGIFVLWFYNIIIVGSMFVV